MRLRGILITFIIILSILFAVLNWGVLVTQVPINFIFFSFPLPIGATLLFLAVIIGIVFFFVSLVERAGQLRQITHLERNIEKLQGKLNKRQQDEVARLEESVTNELKGLVAQLGNITERLEGSTKSGLSEFEQHVHEHLESIEDRLMLVRNELAADIGAAQDSIQRSVEKS